MTSEEFKSLVKERKRLINGINRRKNFLRVQHIDKTLCFDSWSKYHDLTDYKKLYLDCMASAYSRLFDIGRQNVETMLRVYFIDEGARIINAYFPYREEKPVYMELITKKRSYNLGKDNCVLYCLYTDGKADWELLIHDYPDLKDYLWKCFSMLRENKFNAVQDGEKINARPIRLMSLPEENEKNFIKLKQESKSKPLPKCFDVELKK